MKLYEQSSLITFCYEGEETDEIRQEAITAFRNNKWYDESKTYSIHYEDQWIFCELRVINTSAIIVEPRHELSLDYILDHANNWEEFCREAGFSEWAVNEGGGHIKVSLTLSQLKKYGLLNDLIF